MTTPSSSARPFLKWAGGKRQLLRQLRRFYPDQFGAYHEPFLGSGAVFFDLADAARLRRRSVRLTDVNVDLIGCWLQVRDQPDAVIERLRALAAGYSEEPADHYYRIRDKEFNPARADVKARTRLVYSRFGRDAHLPEPHWLQRPVQVELKGNVQRSARPVCTNPRICDEENLRRVSATLAGLAVEINREPYRQVLSSARKGDFRLFRSAVCPAERDGSVHLLHLRRLYQRRSAAASAGCYRAGGTRVSRSAQQLDSAGKSRICTTDNPDALRVGIRAHTVTARRAINSNAARRGEIMEYAITNVPERTD